MKTRLFSLMTVLMLLLSACGQTAGQTPTWQEQYDLGLRYLSEGNYEEAIIAFTAAIEIDPRQETVYLSLAEVYTAMGNTEKAIETLQQAIAALGETEGLTGILTLLAPEAAGEQQPREVARTERIDNPLGTYTICEYDTNDNKICETCYTSDGSVFWICEYDANGDKIRETCYNTNTGFLYFIKDFYANDILKQIIWYNEGGSLDRSYEYDTNGNPSRLTHYALDGTINNWWVYEYDANGNNVRETNYRADGSTVLYAIIEHDANGKPTRKTYYNPDGSVRSVGEY